MITTNQTNQTLVKTLSIFAVSSYLGVLQACLPAVGEEMFVYVGTYTRGTQSQGIYTYRFDRSDGTLTRIGVTKGVENPSFLAVHPSRRFLYSSDEIGDFEGKSTGAVSAFAIDAKSGQLSFLNRQASGGTSPCHLVVDHDGKNVLVVGYGSGTVGVLPIDADGRLQELSTLIRHQGSSVHPTRQEAPHAHSVNLDPAGRIAFVADLGLDQLLSYRFDSATGRLTPNDPPYVKLAPGAGPRHFAFHPSGRVAYVINELDLTVTMFTYDADRGTLNTEQTISVVPEDSDREGVSTAEVVVHPTGKFLYGSIRGLNQIVVFQIDEFMGRLTFVEHTSTLGKTPRNFALDPTGTFLLAENQSSDTVVVFRVDPVTGKLEPTGHKADVPSPVCIRMVAL
jgi:6-phosphogluconolactonase